MTTTSMGLLTVCISEQTSAQLIARAEGRFDVIQACTPNSLEVALERTAATHILIEGLLDVLSDPRIAIRDASRTLGRIKARLESLSKSGVEVVVLCRPLRSHSGARSHFLPSLCAKADRVVTELLAA